MKIKEEPINGRLVIVNYYAFLLHIMFYMFYLLLFAYYKMKLYFTKTFFTRNI